MNCHLPASSFQRKKRRFFVSVSYHPSVPRDLQTRGIISAPFPSPSLAPYLPLSPLHPRHGEGSVAEGKKGKKEIRTQQSEKADGRR